MRGEQGFKILMADEIDPFGGSLFDDFLGEGGIRPGSTVSGVGRLRYRSGSDPKDWSQPGGSDYLPRDWHMQCGAEDWSGGARSSGGFEITFPTPFAEPPLVICCAAGTIPAFEEIRFQTTIQSAAVIEVYWWSTNNLTKVVINWLALGPIGL